MNRRALVLALALAACSSPPPASSSDMAAPVVVDAAVAPDLAHGSAAVGGACVTSTDCGEGSMPTCWHHSLYNKSTAEVVTGGYCSSRCIDEGADGKWCFAPCSTSGDCRDGYKCFLGYGGHCFPSENLECDPTATGGTCTTVDGLAGGCWRAAVGTGNTGFCWWSCDVGVGRCADFGNGTLQCVVADFTGIRDLQGNLTGDHFKGPVCIPGVASNGEGMPCVDANNNHYTNACADGLECDLKGDRRCHRLCHPLPPAPDAGSPDDGGLAGDGGAALSDGGATGDGGASVYCDPGKTCKDVFGLFASKTAIGLCE